MLDVTVTSVGARAFESAQLNAVIIPVGVTAIGIDAFKSARIDSLVLNEGLLSIDNGAFQSMTMSGGTPPLDVTIPNSVISFGAGAFYQAVLGTVILGDGVTQIGQYTFYNNMGSAATSMKLGSNLSSIGEGAFIGLRATNIEFPDSLRSIDNRAFESSTLQSVVFPDELATVHVDAFRFSGSLTVVLYCGSSPGVPNTLAVTVSCVQSTVTFRSNWESDSTSTQTKTLNRKAQLSTSTLQRAGYSFSGWNEASDGSATARADGSEYSFASDLILFAQWTQNATPPQPPAVSAPQPTPQPTPQLVSLVTIERGKDAKYSVLRVALGQTSWAEPILGIQVRLLDTKGNLIRMFVVPLELGTNEVELDLKLPKGSFDVEVVTLSQNGQSQPVVSLPGLASQAFFNPTSKFEEPTLEGTSVSRPILFDGNSSTLRPKAKIGLRRLAERITADDRAISLTGFSAKWSSGESYAEKLATKRAKRVGAFLKRQGVTTWVYFAGYGTLEGEANLASARKVEIRLLD